MKKRSVFTQLILLIFVAVACVVATLLLAFWAGSHSGDLMNWENLNWGNVIPVLLIGGFICCIIVGIIVLFIARNIFQKTKDYLADTNKNGGSK